MELLAADTVHTRNDNWINIFLYKNMNGQYVFLQVNPFINEEFPVIFIEEDDALFAYNAVLANNFLSQFEEEDA